MSKTSLTVKEYFQIVAVDVQTLCEKFPFPYIGVEEIAPKFERLIESASKLTNQVKRRQF